MVVEYAGACVRACVRVFAFLPWDDLRRVFDCGGRGARGSRRGQRPKETLVPNRGCFVCVPVG